MKPARFLFAAILAGSCIGCGEKPFAEYKPGDGKFKIQFPGTPKVSNISGQNNVQVTMHAIETMSWGYLIHHYDIPNFGGVDINVARNALAEDIKGMFSAKAKGTVSSQKDIMLQDRHPGIEYIGQLTSPKSTHIRGRIFLVRDRVYNVSVLGSTDKINSENANKFLDSFQVDP